MAACKSRGCAFPAVKDGFCSACQWKAEHTTKIAEPGQTDVDRVIDVIKKGGKDSALGISEWLDKHGTCRMKPTAIEDVMDYLVKNGMAVLKKPNGSFDRWQLRDEVVQSRTIVSDPVDRKFPLWARIVARLHVKGPATRTELGKDLNAGYATVHLALKANADIFRVDARGIVSVVEESISEAAELKPENGKRPDEIGVVPGSSPSAQCKDGSATAVTASDTSSQNTSNVEVRSPGANDSIGSTLASIPDDSVVSEKENMIATIKDSGESVVTRTPSRLLTCDEVAWLDDVLDRYGSAVSKSCHPGISRHRQAAKLAAIVELFEVLNLGFADRIAAGNAIAGFPELYILRQNKEIA